MRSTRTTRDPSPDLIREFVIAGHWDLPKVKAMLAEHPGLLNSANEWAPGDAETAIQAAAHAGSAHVAEFLLAQGAPLDICTAAMLGRRHDVARFLAEDPDAVRARGAHGIPLMAHAAFSGDVTLVQTLVARGAREGMSMALSNAVTKGHREMARWLLEHGNPDLGWKNYEGKTALEIAAERTDEELVRLLQERGAPVEPLS